MIEDMPERDDIEVVLKRKMAALLMFHEDKIKAVGKIPECKVAQKYVGGACYSFLFSRCERGMRGHLELPARCLSGFCNRTRHLPALDFDKDDRAAVPGDHVQLKAARQAGGTPVPGEYVPTEPPDKARGCVFSQRSELQMPVAADHLSIVPSRCGLCKKKDPQAAGPFAVMICQASVIIGVEYYKITLPQ